MVRILKKSDPYLTGIDHDDSEAWSLGVAPFDYIRVS